jgi:cysteine synthase
MGAVFDNITKTIGRTPLFRLHRITQGLEAEIAVKREFFKPGPHKIQGIGDGFILQVLNTAIIDGVIKVTNDDACAIVTVAPSTGERYLSTPLAADARAEDSRP